jgi:hypothetical protein
VDQCVASFGAVSKVSPTTASTMSSVNAVAGVAAIAALHDVLVMAEMLRHLDLQPGLEHSFGHPSQQPVRADQVHALRASALDQLRSELLVRTISDVVVRHIGPSRPSHALSQQADPHTPMI